MIKYLDMFNKLFVNLIEIAFEVRIGGDMSARMREEKVGHVRKARSQSLPESLQLWVLLFLHFQLFLEDIIPSF